MQNKYIIQQDIFNQPERLYLSQLKQIKMTKQQLLDKENPTPKEAVAQQLLMSTSMTRLKEIGRVIREVEGKLYKTSMKQLPFTEVLQAVETASLLSQDITIEDEKPYQQPGTTKPNVGK